MNFKATPQVEIYTWRCYQAQEPVARNVIGLRGVSITIILLNGHTTKLTPNDLSLHL